MIIVRDLVSAKYISSVFLSLNRRLLYKEPKNVIIVEMMGRRRDGLLQPLH